MNRSETQFQKAYQRLNAEQKRAVDTIEGPVMVIAGPGTGKTQILATRIANILRNTDISASSILALTFTESGASAMKKRLISLIGEAAYSVNIQTFHGFCTEVIATHPEFFSLSQQAEPLSDLERYQILENIFLSSNFELLKPINAPLLYLKTAMSHIQSLKREGVSPEKMKILLSQEAHDLETEFESLKKSERDKRQKNLKKNQELLQVFEAYQEELKSRGRFDFEDMITLTIHAFATHELLLIEYQEKLQYFLVDEYQDTNSAQNTILKQLGSYWGEEANMFVVGDPHQSIYRFQGAALENTFEYLTTYPSATVISLRQNYRSTQLILDASKSVIGNQHVKTELPFPLEQDLISQTSEKYPIHLYEASSDILEHVFIAQTIKDLLSSGVKGEEIAVLYRNNAESRSLADILSRFGILYDIEGGSDVLRHPTISQLLLFFSLLRDIRSAVEDVNLFTALNYEWVGLDPLIILKLSRAAHELKRSLLSLLIDSQAIAEFSKTLPESEITSMQQVVEFIQKCITWSRIDSQKTFPEWFEILIKESGFLEYILAKPDSIEQLNLLNTLFTQIKQLAQTDQNLHLQEFLAVIELMLMHNLHLPEQDLNIRENAIRLTTAHKSKGQEWGYVFLCGLVDKNWGNSVKRELIKLPEGILQFTNSDAESQLADDRRLFYVALTRAKKQLFLSYPKTRQNQTNKELTPSLYLQEIPDELYQKETGFEQRQDLSTLLTMLVQPAVAQELPSTSEREFIDGVLEKFKLSSTALNTYLECAYKFKLQVLLRIPRAKPAPMSFGTAIHKALEFLFGQMKERKGARPSLDEVLAHFKLALHNETFTQDEFLARLKQGNALLTSYYDFYQDQFITPLFVERTFGYGFSRPMLDDIALSGKMDKIEVLNAENKTVKVVDYKTGRARSKNEIEGKTQNSNGNYKRQLVFYKLLAQLDRSFAMTVEETEFDFVQPKENGTFVKHRFSINEQEVEELKTTIKEVMVKIRDQQFLRTTDQKICEECIFQQHCWPDGILKNKV